MNYGNQRRILCKSDKFILSSFTVKGKLKFQIQIIKMNKKSSKSEVIKKFAKLFYLGYHPDLRVQFKQISNFINHLRDQANFQIDDEKGIMKVYGKEGKYKQNSKQIGVIKFQQKRLIENYEPISHEIRYWKVEQKVEQKDENMKKQNKLHHEIPIEIFDKQICQKQEKQNKDEGFIIDHFHIKQIIDSQINEMKQKYKRLIKVMRQQIKQLQQKMEYFAQKMIQKDNLIRKIISQFNPDSDKQIHITRNLYPSTSNINNKKINLQVQSKPLQVNRIEQNSSLQKQFGINKEQMKIILGQQIKLDVYQIRVKINKIKVKIGLGIISYAIKEKQDILFSEDAFVLQSDGNIYCEGRIYQKLIQSLKIQNEKILSISIDKPKGEIEWKIDNQSILKLQNCQKLKNLSKIWIPVVIIYDQNDSIIFC